MASLLHNLIKCVHLLWFYSWLTAHPRSLSLPAPPISAEPKTESPKDSDHSPPPLLPSSGHHPSQPGPFWHASALNCCKCFFLNPHCNVHNCCPSQAIIHPDKNLYQFHHCSQHSYIQLHFKLCCTSFYLQFALYSLFMSLFIFCIYKIKDQSK